jgi:hypothetical protein
MDEKCSPSRSTHQAPFLDLDSDSAPVIERILRHLKRWDRPERPPPPAPERSIYYDPAENAAAEDVKARAFLRELEREWEEDELEGCEFDMDYTCDNEHGGTITSQAQETKDNRDDDILF